MNLKSAFKNGYLNEEMYVTQPPSYEYYGLSKYVYKLYKSLYSLQLVLRTWYDRLRNSM